MKLALFEPPPEEARDVRKGVERPLRGGAGDSVNGVQALYHDGAATGELAQHRLHLFQRGAQRLDGAPLGEGCRVGGRLALYGGHRGDNGFVAGDVTEPPAGHAEGFGEPVCDHGAGLDLLRYGGDAHRLETVVNYVLVNLIAHN